MDVHIAMGTDEVLEEQRPISVDDRTVVLVGSDYECGVPQTDLLGVAMHCSRQ